MPQDHRVGAEYFPWGLRSVSQRTPGYRRIGFLVLNDFSMVSLANAIDVLRMANELLGRSEYSWPILTSIGSTVLSSDGVTQAKSIPYAAAKPLDLVLVCAGPGINKVNESESRNLLQQLASEEISLGGLGWGTHALLKAGVMNGYRCALDSSRIDEFRNWYADVDFKDVAYEIDRDRLSCTYGRASRALMLELIGCRFGGAVETTLSAMLDADPWRGTDLRSPPTSRKSMSGVIELMKSKLDEPLSITELARRSGLSVRQMQRTFKSSYGVTPAVHYMHLRLHRARELILRSQMTMTEVSDRCGFDSLSHFSKSYRSHFGKAPSSERFAIFGGRSRNLG